MAQGPVRVPDSRDNQRRVIIIGKVGAGKSATGNAILGGKDFDSRDSFLSVTTKCAFSSNVRNNIWYEVYDTPGSRGIFPPSDQKATYLEHLKRCLIVTSPGFHAIVYVISAAQRIEEGDTKVLSEFTDLIGKEMFGYSIIVFTHVKPEDIEKRIAESSEISEFCKKCGNRYLSFGTHGNDVQPFLVVAFDEMLGNLIKSNSVSPYYRHRAYAEAENLITRDARDLCSQDSNLLLEDAIPKARTLAYEGKSKRDKEYIKLANNLKCCTIL